MAGDWIKYEVATSDKPEVWAISVALSIDPDAVVGKLLRVWAWFDQHTENSNAPSVSKLLLNRLVGVTDFCETVISCGWMFEDDGFISLPNFDRHNGETAKTRALTAKRVAKHKGIKANEKVTQAPLPKEEKRREDNTNTNVLVKDSPRKPKFTKPTIADLITAFSRKVTSPNIEAQKFLNHYESNGWRVGKNPMKSWPHAVTNWITRSNEDAGNQRNSGQPKLSRKDAAWEQFIAESSDEGSCIGDFGSIERYELAEPN